MLSSNKNAATIFGVLAIAAIVSVTVAYAGEASRALIVAQAAEKAEGEGVIKGIVAGERKLQIAHGPIAALNWPGMTMAFGVAPGVDVSGLMPGAKVRFTLSRDAKGLYVIESIRRIE